MLQLKNIVKEYGMEENKVIALDDINLEFGNKGLVSVLGASGCGKTTLLNIVGGLDKYTSGDLIINGISTKDYKNSDWDAYRNNNVGFVFQNYYLIPHLNVLENLMIAMDLSGVNKEEQRRRAFEALDKVGVANQARKKPKQLSGGQAQRVAIARAFVNKPSIILADEPTGALDSENSVQILSLLKKLSENSLVILVTHNSELAYKYSNRIIKMTDGKIVSDEENIIIEEEIAIIEAKGNKYKKRPTMSMFSAFKLSLKNLYYKKGRTVITSLAGCIGVVSIALILAFNAGFSAYANDFEKDSLSKYPITISKSDSKFLDIMEQVAEGDDFDSSVIDMNQILDMLKDDDEALEAYTDEQKIYMQEQISALMRNTENLMNGNDTTLFKQYIDENFDSSLATVKYDYALNPSVYRIDESDGEVSGYTKLNPYSDRLIASFQSFMSLLGRNSDIMSQEDMEQAVTMMNSIDVWDMMVDDDEVLSSQYDVLAGHLPTDNEEGVYEIVLVVDKYNQITDNMLYALGYIEFISMFSDIIGEFLNVEIKSTIPTEYDFDDFLGKEFKLLLNKDNYVYNSETDLYEEITDDSLITDNITEKGLTLKISGIVRTKENVSDGSVNGVIGYTQALAEYIINNTNDSDIVKAQQAEYAAYLEKTENAEVVALQNALKSGEIKQADLTIEQQILIATAAGATIKSVITGETIDEAGYNEFLTLLGVEDLDSPETIYFYPKSVEAKDSIIQFIEDYNSEMKQAYDNEEAESDNSVEYTNELNDIMGSLTGMINTITYILIAITCLAVIVSLFMVGIIMYISVQDRTKEIGVLRSMGARNFDIMTIFNSETILLGLISGLIGVGLSYALKYPINLILKSVMGISNLIQPVWWNSLLLIGAAAVLTVISGLVPAIIASKKDPVVALKVE